MIVFALEGRSVRALTHTHRHMRTHITHVHTHVHTYTHTAVIVYLQSTLEFVGSFQHESRIPIAINKAPLMHVVVCTDRDDGRLYVDQKHRTLVF